MEYRYITKDNLEYRQKYSYSAFGGEEFLKAYFDSRRDTLKELSPQEAELEFAYEQFVKIMQLPVPVDCKSGIDMSFLLVDLVKQIQSGYQESSLIGSVLKTFEVRKRLYHLYSENFKPLDEEDYKDYQLYLLFASLMSCIYERTNNLKYLNALLKCNDILISLYQKGEGLLNIHALAFVLNKELKFIKILCAENNIEL